MTNLEKARYTCFGGMCGVGMGLGYTLEYTGYFIACALVVLLAFPVTAISLWLFDPSEDDYR